ncbi:ArsR/SmtB family transcription factor [Flavisolibacter nicotianae]|uniref:ArsR/SmtB family transcription factor n=1 Tax=Flavisolibacter nicotianae TaxID=2364882 RepID=UPI000EB3D355|nr:metalloregulator ArsR/SmtB family transcription factor [Flavisolibacter nicotianae]
MGLTKQEFFSPDENYTAEIFRTLAHPCRIRIISTLLFNESRTVGDMTEQFNGLTQSTISEHIRQLKEADLITGKQVGTTIRYSLNRAIWEHYKWVLAAVGNDAELMLLYR